jgi:hypothetical protein
MSKIQNSIQEVADYLKTKVLSGEYEFLTCNDYAAKVLIDKEFAVNIWITGNHKTDCGIYCHDFENGIMGSRILFTSQEQRSQAWKNIKPHVIKYKETILKSEKEASIKRLTKELKKLNN